MIIEIIGACISGIVAIITCSICNRKSTAIMQYKIDALTDEVHTFNNIKCRMYEAEKEICIMGVKIKNIKEELEDIKNEKKIDK